MGTKGKGEKELGWKEEVKVVKIRKIRMNSNIRIKRGFRFGELMRKMERNTVRLFFCFSYIIHTSRAMKILLVTSKL